MDNVQVLFHSLPFLMVDFCLSFSSMHLFYSIVMYSSLNIGIPVQAHSTGWFHLVETSILGISKDRTRCLFG